MDMPEGKEGKIVESGQNTSYEKEALSSLQDVEKFTVASSFSSEIKNFSDQLEIQKYEALPLQTYQEIVKGTPLEQKILKVFSYPDFDQYPELKDKTPEQRTEYLFRKINTAVSRFYVRKLSIPVEDPVPGYLQKVITPATEWFLMDILRGGQSNNVNFLGELSHLNLQSLSNLFTGVKAFSEKFTVPYGQAKKLMLISDFLSLPQQRVFLQKLDNPYNFYEKVMKNPLWDKPDLDINILKFSDFGFVQDEMVLEKDSGTLTQLLESGKNAMRSSIGSIQMVEDNPETLKKLLGMVDKTGDFFSQTEKISTGLLDSLDQLGGVDATLQSFGIDILGSLKDSKLLSGVLNFVLGLLGFSGGIAGLERSWRRRQIEKSLSEPKRLFIKDILKTYCETRESTDFSQQIIDKFKLQGISQDQQSKLNIDLERLTNLMTEKLTEVNQINPQVLLSLPSFGGDKYVEKIKSGDKDVLSVKSDFFSDEENKQKFMNEYMQVVLPKMLSNVDFVQNLESSNELAFALIAGVGVDADTLMFGIKSKALLPSEFFEGATLGVVDAKQEKSGLELHGYKGELLFYDKIPGTDQDKLAFKTKVEAISQELNINPNWLMAVMYKETGGKFDPSVRNPNGGATGLIQFMPSTAKSFGTTTEALSKMTAVDQLDYVKKFYQGTKYSSLTQLYLKTFFPIALGHINEPDYVFQSKDKSALAVAKANPGIAGKDASITMRDFDHYIARIVKEDIPDQFKSQFA